MTEKIKDNAVDIVKVSAVIICLPILGWLMLTGVTLYQLPQQMKVLSDKIDAISLQTNKNSNDIHILKQILHIDGGYAMSTNVFKIVSQSNEIKEN